MMTVFMIHHCVCICLFSTVLTIRNYLKKAGCQQHTEKWTVQKMPHNQQQDAWSCGILVLMVKWLLLLQKFPNFLNHCFQCTKILCFIASALLSLSPDCSWLSVLSVSSSLMELPNSAVSVKDNILCQTFIETRLTDVNIRAGQLVYVTRLTALFLTSLYINLTRPSFTVTTKYLFRKSLNLLVSISLLLFSFFFSGHQTCDDLTFWV